MIQFSKGELVVLTESLIKKIYYWKYEEPMQAAKKWNGPYIKEPEMDKPTFLKEMKQNRFIYPNVEGTLAIIIDEQFIGTVASYWVDKQTNWLEIGIVIYDSDYWESGIGSEVFQCWIDYLFDNNFIHRLGISTWSGNVRMIKLASKVGMQEEARIRQARQVNGRYFDAIKMGILKSEWLNNRSKK
ncbi:GNAT family N-acetyltransferase [Staphylococcus caeli]|uniref:GNAT family N-acetyltransferase n=1 Tax=Staphylococcus caeli TaxID=2201815 RepID=UPI003F5741D0